MQKLQILCAVALFLLFIGACHGGNDGAPSESNFIEKMDSDPFFTVFTDQTLESKIFELVNNITEFFEAHKRPAEIAAFLAVNAFIYSEELTAAYEMIVTFSKSKSILEYVEEIIFGAGKIITDALQLVKVGFSTCLNTIKTAFTNPLNMGEVAIDGLESMVDVVYKQLVDIIEKVADRQLYLHLVPESKIIIKFLLSIVSAFIIKIIESLDLKKYDTCKIKINLEGHFQTYVMERYKRIEVHYINFESKNWHKCSVEQGIFDLKFNENCPDYDKKRPKCIGGICTPKLRAYKRNVTIEDKFVNNCYYSRWGKPRDCLYYYLCRVRDNMKIAFERFQKLTHLKTDNCGIIKKSKGIESFN